MEFRGSLGGMVAFLFLLSLQSALVAAARRRATQQGTNRVVKFMDLIITSEDENYSLSRLQFYLWTFFVVIGFGSVFMAKFQIPAIPQNLALLMGVNLSSSVLSTAITSAKPGIKQTIDPPDFVRDVFFESADSLDLPRTQMFIWTVISLLIFSVMLIKSFIDGSPLLPEFPLGLVALMGLSQGAYLGAKAAK